MTRVFVYATARPKRDSLLSETSAVLLAERMKDEFETSAHERAHKVSNALINGMPLCMTGICIKDGIGGDLIEQDPIPGTQTCVPHKAHVL